MRLRGIKILNNHEASLALIVEIWKMKDFSPASLFLRFSILLWITAGMIAGCKKADDDSPGIPKPKTKLVHTATGLCTIGELYWMPDSRHILMNDFCNGTLKYIDSENGTFRLLYMPGGVQYQRFFVSDSFPGTFFYLALANQTDYNLYSFTIASNASELIYSGLTSTSNPLTTRYLVKGKYMAISGNPITIINLESGMAQTIPGIGSIRTFSQDGEHLLYYSLNPVAAHEYDFSCNCETPVTSAGLPTQVVWTQNGYYGSTITPGTFANGWNDSISIWKLEQGEVLVTKNLFIEGPVSASNGAELLFFDYNPGASSQNPITVNALDIPAHTVRTILSIPGVPYTSLFKTPLYYSISPDQTRLATGFDGVNIYVSELEE